MERRPEPELMDSEAQTSAYAAADFSESNSLFVDRFLKRFAGLAGTGRLADLGCGPGDITIRLAVSLPGWEVLGLDAGPNMLKLAEQLLAEEAGLDKVSFRQSYLPDSSLPLGAFDAVVSHSLLHHLPDPQTLWKSIARIAAPGASIQVMDLSRPDSLQDAQRLIDQYAADEPDVLREDFYNSLLAAWTLDEVRDQLARAGLTGLDAEMASDRHWVVSGTLRV